MPRPLPSSRDEAPGKTSQRPQRKGRCAEDLLLRNLVALSPAYLGHVHPGRRGPQAKLTAERCSTHNLPTATRELDWTRTLKRSPAEKKTCCPTTECGQQMATLSQVISAREGLVQPGVAPRGAPVGRPPSGQPEALSGRVTPSPAPSCFLLSPRRWLTNIAHPSLLGAQPAAPTVKDSVAQSGDFGAA